VLIFLSHDIDKKDLTLKQKYVCNLSAGSWSVEKNEVMDFIFEKP